MPSDATRGGARAEGRIGLLVPSSNTTVEPEFQRALPESVTLHTARLFLTDITPEAIARIVEDLEAQSRLLATADVDVIVLGATAPSFLKGAGYDREMIGRIVKASGKPATTTSTALLRALALLGAKRIVLCSAYTDRVNAIARGFLEANGIEVLAARGLGMADNLAVGRLGPESAYELARAAAAGTDADAVVLACTNWRSMAVIEKLERELGRPVLSTTQASVWDALRIVGYRGEIAGYGRLLATLAVESRLAAVA
ncbi:MAG: aspartate/glutamate racemase family protein [Burkholderiales bacterium]|nr:aspartate/glutamate racemase family protein [Burkholderiales bacterium]